MPIITDVQSSQQKFYLTQNDLRKETWYLCDNGTVVVKIDSTGEVINVENGLGKYSDERRFRPLIFKNITFTTNYEGRARGE